MRHSSAASSISAIIASTVLASGAFAAPKKASDLKSEKDKISYILGHQIGGNFKKNSIELNSEIFAAAVNEALAGKTSVISTEDTQKIMTEFQGAVQKKAEAKRKEQGDKNVETGKKFLAENGKKPGVVTLTSGLQYKILKEGAGAAPKASDTVTTHYEGRLIDGTVFDSSIKRKEPASFPVNGVIKGWTEALQLMKPGAKWQLYVPSDLAYGAQGAGADIGPNSTLIFDVELISIAAPEKKEEKKEEKKDEKK